MDLFTFPLNSFSPIDEQIYIQIRNLIVEHKLDGITELPSARELAIHLKQSQADISSAYRQLEIEGYVTKKDNIFSLSTIENETTAQTNYSSTYKVDEKHFQYDFIPNIVDQQHFPIDRWNDCLREASLNPMIYAESDVNGEPLIKQALVAHFSTHRNISVSEANIFIGSSIQTLLIRLGMFLKEKDYFNSFIIENPGNRSSYNIFKSLGYTTSSYRVTPEKHNIDEIPEERALLYLTPSQQQPLGITLPVEQRFQLIAWAQRNDSLIIEDDNDSEFRYNGRSITPMASMNSGHVAYIGSFSRSFLPSLRVAYLLLPDRFVEEYHAHNKNFEQSSSSIAQIAVANFIKKGYMNEHFKKMLAIYEQKMTVLATKISTTFPSTVSTYSDDSGQYLLVQPNNGMTEEQLIDSASKFSVRVYPSSVFFLEGRKASAPIILLGFGRLSRPEILTGIERLAKAWFDE
ncbi:MAG: PLP-dependent aminotransferase family protein [Kurthia sp.]|nr:PLP-dependent aminotransferase family protein [Candidatus Kurthia equi]